MPSPKPSDIYGVVAEGTEGLLRGLVQSGDEKAGVASDLLELGITRKETKRSVMVVPYGGTMRACLSYVEEALQDKGLEIAIVDKDRRKQVKGLGAKAVWDAMEEPLGTAKELMRYLQKASRLLSKRNLGCNWTAPSGFPVSQRYMVQVARKVQAGKTDGVKTSFVLLDDTGKVDGTRQASGIAPNIVHSYDAAHMTLTVERLAREEGVLDFALVHDSFGVHASHMPAMQRVLREVFLEIYSEDVPATLAAELMYHDETECPQLGTWEPESVLEADYFFS